jgi:chromosome segregation ATPase
MNNRIGIIVLLVLCLGLGVALVIINKKSSDQRLADTKKIDTVSNQLVQTSSDLDEQKKVAVNLEKDLEAKKNDIKGFEKSLGDLTNNFTEVSANLAKTEAVLKDVEKKVKEQDAKIADLEAQNQALDKKAEALSNSLTNLNAEIADTKHKLAASEGDKAFLQLRLKDLIAEKTELERQFNDLTIVRAQVSKLKSEAAVARRMEWSRLGILASSEQKGAQRLMQGFNAPQTAGKPNYDLNVEVKSDGSVRVVPLSTNQVPPTKTGQGR